MNLQFTVQVALPIALVIIMFGLGLTLRLDDFKRVVQFPKAALVGLVCQMFVLPAAALAICYVSAMQPAFAVGLMLLAASPGGATSNIYSHLAKGDVALNLTLTAINSVLSAVTLPVFTMLALRLFSSQELTIGLQTKKFLEVLILIAVPTCLGMLARTKRPELSRKLEKPIKIFSVVFLVVIVAGTLFKEHKLFTDNIAEVGWAVFGFNLLSLAVGYFVPRLAGLSRQQATAITFEVGIHNGALALFVAMSVLGSTTFAVPAALYSVLMYFTAAAMLMVLKKRNH